MEITTDVRRASKEEHDGQWVAYMGMEAQTVEFHVAVRAVDHSIISGRDLRSEDRVFKDEHTSNSDTILFVNTFQL